MGCVAEARAERECVSWSKNTVHLLSDCGSYSGVSSLFRTASVPDVVGRRPKRAFSFVRLVTRKVLPSRPGRAYPSTPVQHVKVSPSPELPETFGKRASSIRRSMLRVSNSQLGMWGQNPTIVISDEFKQVYSLDDGLAMRDQGKRKVQHLQHRLGYKEDNGKQDVIDGSFQPSYRSCVHLEVPLWATISVVFLDKSLLISLVELDGRRAGQSPLYRSTLSFRLGVSSCRRFPIDSKPTKIHEGYRKPRVAMLGHNKHRNRRLDHCRDPLPKPRGPKVEHIASTCGVNSETDVSDTECRSDTLGLLSFRRPSPANTKAGRQKGNADEAAFFTQRNFRDKHYSSIIGPDSRRWSKQAGCDTAEEQQENDCSRTPQKVSALDKNCSRLKCGSLRGTSKTLSLKEALELLRPDFISRSQDRVRRLEQRAMRRRALRDSNPDLLQGYREDRCKQKRNCTTPDPISDNLFKPRERSISGREMQLRSRRRIYNKLPEVTKRKEEAKKRAISQTNRLRAEVFKKRLLDQLLQR